MSRVTMVLAVGFSLLHSTPTSAMGGWPTEQLLLSEVRVDGLALPMQSFTDDPIMSETFRKLIPYVLDINILQEQCASEPRYEAAVFSNPVSIRPLPDAPLDENAVAAAQGVTEAALDAYQKDQALNSLKVIWTAEELEAAAFNNSSDQPQTSRARLRTVAKYLSDVGLEPGQDGMRRDDKGEIVSLDIMVESPRLNSNCHLNFLKAAIDNLRRNGIHTNVRACTLSVLPGNEISEEARKVYLDCIGENTDVQFYQRTARTDLSLAFALTNLMGIDLDTMTEIAESANFQPMSPADQAAGMALAFGKRAIETGRLIPITKFIFP